MDVSCESIATIILGRPAKRRGQELLYRCLYPERHQHGDANPSLSVNPAKDCFLCAPCGVSGSAWGLAAFLSGLSPDDKPGITGWLREHGLPNGNRSGPEAIYPYTDEQGVLLYEVVRFPGKKFRQRRPDGNGGWVWNLNGTRRVLYNLPAVLKAQGHLVLVAEGEKDCETARRLGFVATTNPHGAGKWRAEYSAFLRGDLACIIGDADASGLAHARDIARSLLGIARAVKLVEALPGAKDLSEWVEKGGTRQQLVALVKSTPVLTAADVRKWQPATAASGFNLVPLGELLSKPNAPVDYIWDGILVAGTISGVFAKPKVGKGTLARNLCLAVSGGKDFLGLKTKKGECIYLALEEREEDVQRDFRAMGADGTEPILIHAAAAPAEGIRALCELVRERKPRLVSVDPIIRLARIKEEKAYAEMYNELGPLIDAARETGTHIIISHHSGKALKLDPIDSPLGGTGFAGIVSTLIALKRTETYRTFQTVQRIGEDVPETVLKFDPKTKRLSVGGARSDVDRGECEARIMEFLSEAGESQTRARIRDGVEGQTKIIEAALKTLVASGKVKKTGDGTKGKPFVYGLPNTGSQDIPGTSKPESPKLADTRENTGGILVPENDGNPILVPENSQAQKPANSVAENGHDSMEV